MSLLNEFQSRPGVDQNRLRTVISNLLRLRADLLACGSAFLQPLKDSNSSPRSAIAARSRAAPAEFDLPDYYFWLSQPAAPQRDLRAVAGDAAAAVR